MASQVDVCNLALMRLGTRSSISSLAEGSTEANACAVLWTPALDSTLRAHPWSWARRQAAATVLAAAAGRPENPDGTGRLPPVPWIYQYAEPTDCVAMRRILPSTQGAPNPPYQLAGDVDGAGNAIRTILTDQAQAVLIYTARVDTPIVWDPEFVDAFSFILAAALAQTLTGDRDVLAAMQKLANSSLLTARAADDGEQPKSGELRAPWLVARGYSPNITASPYLDPRLTGE